VPVLVVGGGITGVSVLAELHRRGITGVLVERDRLAAGASGHNAGFVLRGVAANYSAAVRRYGRSLAGEIWDFTAESAALLGATLGSAGDGALRRRGSWSLAASAEEATELVEAASLLAEDGLDARFFAEVPGAPAGYRGGLLNPDDAELDPVAAVIGVAGRVPPERVLEGVAVLALEAAGEGVRVESSVGECRADAVVVATNAETSRLVPEAGIAPVRGQMLASAPWPASIADRPVYADRGFQYWRQLSDGRVLVGGFRDRAMAEEATADPAVTARLQAHLDAQLERLGVSAPAEHRWAGIMGFTADHLPVVGPIAGLPGVHVCGGYSGHGMGFASLCARRLVEHLLDGRPLPDWLSASRFAVPAGDTAPA
jgi:gamma-glutamylputrescine oxidase